MCNPLQMNGSIWERSSRKKKCREVTNYHKIMEGLVGGRVKRCGDHIVTKTDLRFILFVLPRRHILCRSLFNILALFYIYQSPTDVLSYCLTGSEHDRQTNGACIFHAMCAIIVSLAPIRVVKDTISKIELCHCQLSVFLYFKGCLYIL